MKKALVIIFVALLALSLFSCSASPTAIKVGPNKVDASEYAYYLNYNRMNLDALAAGTTVLNAEELLTQAREQTKQHIATAEIVRIKCEELGIKLTAEQKEEMKAEKEELIESFGGLGGYLSYLRENALTDRLYDKLQENNYYYSMLHDHVTQGEDSISTDQQLRQFFAENYFKVRYIRFSAMDENGEPLDEIGLEQLVKGAEDILNRINGGELTFDKAIEELKTEAEMNGEEPSQEEDNSGVVLSKQELGFYEFGADANMLDEGQVGGVYSYSDGYYIIERLAPDMGYFEANREEIEMVASDWAFNNFISMAQENIPVAETGVCKKINFTNLMEYVK